MHGIKTKDRSFGSGLFLGRSLFNLGLGGVLLHALNAVFAAGLGLIALADGDDLAVGGLQAETELTGLILVHFKLGMGQDLEAFLGLVFNTGDGGILLDRGDTAAAGSFGSVDLRSGDDLTVGGLSDRT